MQIRRFLFITTAGLALTISGASAAQTPPASNANTPPAPTAPKRPVATTSTLRVQVTADPPAPIAGAHISVIGPALRDAAANSDGAAAFTGIAPGTYRVRAEADGFITLEKDVTLKAGVPQTAKLVLSKAPPAPEPPPPPVAPPPPPPPPAPTGVRGEPRSLSMTDLAERSLGGREAVKVVPVSCSGTTSSRLVVVKESLPMASYDDADEQLYLIAGEGVMTLDGKDQPLQPGWFAAIPRDTKFAMTKKGRNPMVLLSVIAGRPCQPVDPQAAAHSLR